MRSRISLAIAALLGLGVGYLLPRPGLENHGPRPSPGSALPPPSEEPRPTPARAPSEEAKPPARPVSQVPPTRQGLPPSSPRSADASGGTAAPPATIAAASGAPADEEWSALALDTHDGASLAGGMRNFQEAMRGAEGVRDCGASWVRPPSIRSVEIEFEVRMVGEERGYRIVEAKPLASNVSDQALEECIARRWAGLFIPAVGVKVGERARVSYPVAFHFRK